MLLLGKKVSCGLQGP